MTEDLQSGNWWQQWSSKTRLLVGSAGAVVVVVLVAVVAYSMGNSPSVYLAGSNLVRC